ncbi:antitoxin [Pseudonocardia spinosispora]|uniref:antitoxin n=1 Tax=Pseudonocardia spinosispora TaxID=103441 RepID=UPI0005603F52|nr:antitoxin [Pseudonocardia spinosispora]
MELGNLVNKVKEWAGKNPDKADSAVDKGTGMVKQKFAGHDSQIDSASEKAKNYLHGSGEQQKQQEQPPPPPPQ